MKAEMLVTNYTRTMMKGLASQSGLTMKKIVETMNEKYPECSSSVQNVTNKLSKGTLRLSEAEAMARSIGYTLKFVKVEEQESAIQEVEENNTLNTNADKVDEEMVMIPKSVLKGMIGELMAYI